MDNATANFIHFLNYCNNQLVNTTDYTISRIILRALANEGDLSMETIANQANISQASVSRFIRKAGFASYGQAISDMRLAQLDIKLNRQLNQQARYLYKSEADMVEEIYRDAISNIEATKNQLNLPRLHTLVDMLQVASSVTFLGDIHALTLFFTLQLDLMAKGKTTYLYHQDEFVDLHEHFMSKDDLLIYLNVSEKFLSPQQISFLKRVQKQKTKIVVFSQEKLSELSVCFDLFYQYGLPDSMNDGYYSLYFISQVLSELVVKADF